MCPLASFRFYTLLIGCVDYDGKPFLIFVNYDCHRNNHTCTALTWIWDDIHGPQLCKAGRESLIPEDQWPLQMYRILLPGLQDQCIHLWLEEERSFAFYLLFLYDIVYLLDHPENI